MKPYSYNSIFMITFTVVAFGACSSDTHESTNTKRTNLPDQASCYELQGECIGRAFDSITPVPRISGNWFATGTHIVNATYQGFYDDEHRKYYQPLIISDTSLVIGRNTYVIQEINYYLVNTEEYYLYGFRGSKSEAKVTADSLVLAVIDFGIETHNGVIPERFPYELFIVNDSTILAQETYFVRRKSEQCRRWTIVGDGKAQQMVSLGAPLYKFRVSLTDINRDTRLRFSASDVVVDTLIPAGAQYNEVFDLTEEIDYVYRVNFHCEPVSASGHWKLDVTELEGYGDR